VNVGMAGYRRGLLADLLFCEHRELNSFECTPSILNLFMLHAAQQGKSVGVIESFLSAWSFVSRFFFCTDYTQD
jgi:hypothetical protein